MLRHFINNLSTFVEDANRQLGKRSSWAGGFLLKFMEIAKEIRKYDAVTPSYLLTIKRIPLR